MSKVGIGNIIDADINDRRPFANVLGFNKSGTAYRRDNNVGLACNRRQIGRPRMADRYGCVLLKKEHRHRFTDDIAAADDHGVLARDRNVRPL